VVTGGRAVSAYRHTQIGLVVTAALVGAIVLVFGAALTVERLTEITPRVVANLLPQA